MESWPHGGSLEANGELSAKKIDDDFAHFKSAYVAALLAKVPGVTYTTNPIILHKSRRM